MVCEATLGACVGTESIIRIVGACCAQPLGIYGKVEATGLVYGGGEKRGARAHWHS